MLIQAILWLTGLTAETILLVVVEMEIGLKQQKSGLNKIHFLIHR